MSIIQDALKKVQEYKERGHAPRENILKEPAAQESGPLEKPALSLEKTTPYKNRFRLTIFLIVVFAALSAIVIKQYFWSAKAFTKMGSKDAAHNQEITYKTITSADIKSEENPAMQNQTVEKIAPPQATQLPNLVLSGVMYLEEGSRAIINNSIVEEGDTIGGARIAKINRRSVVLRSDDVEITLTLK